MFLNETNAPINALVHSLNTKVNILQQILIKVAYNVRGSKKRRGGQRESQQTFLGMTRAICIETLDPWKENRIRFFHPLLHDPKTPVLSLPFARPVSSAGGFDDCGMTWVPPAGSTVVIFFDQGVKEAPYYFGTTWHRDRGAGGNLLNNIPGREYKAVSDGHRTGYFHGPGSNPDDESQVLPPWNTENYNNYDTTDLVKFFKDTEEQRRFTYPHIYGWKTPEKHMIKMVDGNAQCNRRWKRLEIQSSRGQHFIMKDDHLHYGGQWANPECPPDPGGPEVDICADKKGKLPYFTDFHGKPKEGEKALCAPNCNKPKGVQCEKIMEGHTSTMEDPPDTTTHSSTNMGTNPFFKHKNECYPIRGPMTPQNNKLDLPQTGIQMLSLSGQTMVFDDSVEEPRKLMNWERSLEKFDFGCNDKFLGGMYLRSATGHEFSMSDHEEETGLRSDQNGVRISSANGSRITLNDHTTGPPVGMDECKGQEICPPRVAGSERGVHIESTSEHIIKLIDHLNEQCSPCRKKKGQPVNKATQAFMQFRSGYGHELRFDDIDNQRKTNRQWIQLTHPQKARNSKEKGNPCGPHFLRFQGSLDPDSSVILLRAGGHSIRSTCRNDIVIVGDPKERPSDKFTYVSKNFVTSTEKTHFRYAGEMHILFAEQQVLLMSGRDCPPAEGQRCKGPCLYPVIVARCPVACPITGIIHWTEQAVSEKVFVSANNPCSNGGCKDYKGSVVQDCTDNDAAMAAAKGPPCQEEGETIDTGAGDVQTPGLQPESGTGPQDSSGATDDVAGGFLQF